MITTNANQIADELRSYRTDIERKLENMVRGFITELAVTAIDATPIGDSQVYEKLYKLRYMRTGLQPIEGLAKGAWVATTNPAIPFLEHYGASSGTRALSSVSAGLTSFKLGQNVYLGNSTPYIGMLENGYSSQAPEGISKIVMAVYKPDLVRYFREG